MGFRGTTTIDVSYLPDAEDHPLWPGIYTMLEPAAKLGAVEVLGKGHLVWIAADGGVIIGAATTRLLMDGGAELINVGGVRAKDWAKPLEDVICQWARACGCETIVSRGRKGWVRIVVPLGWKAVDVYKGMTLFEKVL